MAKAFAQVIDTIPLYTYGIEGAPIEVQEDRVEVPASGLSRDARLEMAAIAHLDPASDVDVGGFFCDNL